MRLLGESSYEVLDLGAAFFGRCEDLGQRLEGLGGVVAG